MKILVTGGAGFIGSHLVPRLLHSGHAVSCMVRYSSMASEQSKRRLQKLEKLQETHKGKLTLIRCEDVESLATALVKVSPEVCVHLGGRSWVRESVGYPELYEEANYRTTVGLLEGLRKNGCRRVVFASSVMVYGKDAPLPYSEEVLGCAPESPYGASKLACEVLLNMYRDLYKMEVANLRLFSVYGPDLRPDCVPYLIAAAILRNRPFTVFGDGESMRDYIEIGDVLEAIDKAIDSKESFPALNVGSGFGTSLLELIHGIEQCLGKKAELVYKPAVAGELPVAIPDITTTIEKLKWEPAVNLEKGLQSLAAWFVGREGPFPNAAAATK